MDKQSDSPFSKNAANNGEAFAEPPDEGVLDVMIPEDILRQYQLDPNDPDVRFYDIDAGEIAVDGRSSREYTRASLRRSFGMVLQDSWLFEGTVHENIAYGRADATREQVIEAARRAHADKFIRQLPQGYDTMIGEDGGTFSQGQKQLLCIARVMLTNPAILLLDEATSSIDTRTELQVQEAFDELMAGRTSFVVAHRLSTIRNADCILVMRDGQIIERGTHEELLAAGGFYAGLYNSQWAVEE